MAESAPASRSHSHVPVGYRGEQPNAAEVSSDGYTNATTEACVITGIGIVAEPADDVDEALRLYGDLLGTGNATVQQRPSARRPMGAVKATRAVASALRRPPPACRRPHRRRVVMSVPDSERIDPSISTE
jgi:hypothetical protein